MASAMGSWWAQLAPAMYCVILDTMSGVSCTAREAQRCEVRAGPQSTSTSLRLPSRVQQWYHPGEAEGPSDLHPHGVPGKGSKASPDPEDPSLRVPPCISQPSPPASCVACGDTPGTHAQLQPGKEVGTRGSHLGGVGLTSALGLQPVEQVPPGQVLEEVVVAVIHGAQVPGHRVGAYR